MLLVLQSQRNKIETIIRPKALSLRNQLSYKQSMQTLADKR